MEALAINRRKNGLRARVRTMKNGEYTDLGRGDNSRVAGVEGPVSHHAAIWTGASRVPYPCRMMFEQRAKRSEVREEALQYLVEAVLDRSDVKCAALIDGNARIVAGAGTAADLVALARIASAVARGDAGAIDVDDDVIAREIPLPGGTLVLAALGDRVRRLPDAANAVARICAA